MAKLIDTDFNVTDLHSLITNNIGTYKDCEIRMYGVNAEDIHAGIKKMGNGWYLLNLSNDKMSVSHRGYPVEKSVQIRNGDIIYICGLKYLFIA